MKKVMGLVLCQFFLTTAIFAQEVKEVKVKNLASFGMPKFKDAPKKVFVQEFYINYQMVYDQTSIAKGSPELGGGARGSAKAQLILGLQGIQEADLQAMTDQLYKEYTDRLKQAGFEIVTAADLQGDPTFEGWTVIDGGEPNKAQFPGYITTAPSNTQFFIKKETKSGKRKTKGGAFDNGMGTSKSLGGIIVARVNVAIPFVEDGQSQGSRALTKTFGGVAKVVARPSLGVVNATSFQVKGGFAQKTIILNSNSLFAFKKGLKYQATLNVVPKKTIAIDGVLEDKKYKAVKSAEQDLWGSDYGAIRVFSASDAVLEKMQAVPCDPEVYKKGVMMGSSAYLNASLDEFLKYQ